MSILPELLQNGEVRFFSKVPHGTPIEGDAAKLGAKRRLAVTPRVLFRIERKLRGKLSPKTSYDIYDYLDVDRTEVQKVISSEMGWKKSGEHFEHTDCGLHPVVGYVHSLRFPDVTPETAHLSGCIRMGEITRDEALRIENELHANPEHPEILAGFLREIGMPRTEFDRCAPDWRAAQLFGI